MEHNGNQKSFGDVSEFLIYPCPPELCHSFTSKENIEEVPKQVSPRREEKPEFVASWTSNQTKVLLDVYKNYRSKVGSFKIKNLKKLFEVMAEKINEILKTNYNASHVEYRWRVIERAYKKFLDNPKKTGSGKKYFEYQLEMDYIVKGKKNVNPHCLLSTDTVELLRQEENVESLPSSSSAAQTPVKSPSLRRRNRIASRNITIAQIRRDRKEYNRKRFDVEKNKLEQQRQKIVLMGERNVLLRERNELLKNRTCSSCSRDFLLPVMKQSSDFLFKILIHTDFKVNILSTSGI